MKLVTRWTLAKGAANFLRRHGAGYGAWMEEGWRANTQAALDALGPNPHPDRVKGIWPNAFGDLCCDQCGERPESVVELNGCRICARCLLAAMKLIEP